MNAVAIRVVSREHWLAERQLRVGASEIPSLFGCGYLTVRELWEHKAGHIQPEDLSDNLPVILGHRLESGFAAVLRAVKGWRLRKTRRYLVHGDPELRLGCTLDFELLTPDAAWIPVELKVFDYSSFADQFDETEVSGGYDPGLRQSLQLQTQLIVTGKPRGIIAVLVSNRQIVVCDQNAEPTVQRMIVERVRDFWRSIECNDPPAFDHDRDLELMARVMTNLQAGLELDWFKDDEGNSLIAAYGQFSANESSAKESKDRIRARLYEKLGNAVRARCATGQVSAKVSASGDGARKSLRVTPRKS